MQASVMTMSGRSAIVLSLFLAFASCVHPVHKMFRDALFMEQVAGRKAWRNVAVLPFAGDPAFRRSAAEWFAFRVRQHGLFAIVDPSLAEIELKKQGMLFGEAAATVEEASKAGRLLRVDGVVFGSVDPKPPQAQPGPPRVAASLLDTTTGKVVADSIQSYVRWTPYSRDRVIAAVDRVAEDLVPVLYAAAGKPWTPPPKKEPDGPEPPGHEAPGMGR